MVADRVSRMVSGCLRIDAYVYLSGSGLVKKKQILPPWQPYFQKAGYYMGKKLFAWLMTGQNTKDTTSW
jgi:hypothetical protein